MPLYCAASPEQVFDLLLLVMQLLDSALQSRLILLTAMDLLVDVVLVCWEVSRPLFCDITSHDNQTCKVFLDNITGSRVRGEGRGLVASKLLCHAL